MIKHLVTFFCVSLVSIEILSGAGKEIEGERAPASTICPTPEEARAKMSVPEGYEVRCFAHEPMVQNPVAMTWDHRGRLWVVEAYEYPNGSEHPAPFDGKAKDDQYHPVPNHCLPTKNEEPRTRNLPRDRVIILEDTDNNGEADKRTVFVEGLNLASAILCGDGGIYVGQQPHLIHFRDDDGDDKPDAWRVVLTGFGREDTHELVNSFTWGPDGWLYMTHGVFTNSKVRRPGQPESEGFKFDAGIGRARPTSREKAAAWEFEVFADGTSNPWGCDYDAAGNFFVSACVIDHFFHMAPGGIYVRQGGAPENPYAYELLPSIVKHKHFRAAYAGIQIYQGDRYPADTHGHAFIGNIHDNAIHEEVLTPVGATFKCEPRRDFLRANDGWFRPVSTQTGPDGFLWIMDWCDKYPCYQNAKANPEGVDRERGRIWRVVTTQDSSVVPASAGQANVSKTPPKGGTTEHASRPASDLDLKKLAFAAALSSDLAGKPPLSAHRMSLVHDRKGIFHDGKGLVRDGQSLFDTDKTQSLTEKVLSATDKTKSITDQTKSVTDKTKSMVDQTFSVTDQTKSVTNKTPSVTDQTNSIPEHTNSMTDQTFSVTDQTQSVTEKVSSGSEKGPRFIKTVISTSSHDHSRPETDLNLKKLPTADLVKTLEHPNNWMRRMARRMLVEQPSRSQSKLDSIEKAWLESSNAASRIEAFWAASNLGHGQVTLSGPSHQDTAIRIWSARTLGEGRNHGPKDGISHKAWTVKMLKLANDEEPSVRLATAAALRQWSAKGLTVTYEPLGYLSLDIFEALLKANNEPKDQVLPHLIWMGFEPMIAARATDCIQTMAAVFPTTQPLSRVLSNKAMRRLCDTRKAENLDLAVEFCDKIAAHDVLLAHALDGLVKGQEGGVIKPTKDVSASLAKWRSNANTDVRKHAQTLAVLWGDDAAVKEMIAVLHDAKKSEKDRITVLQSLRKVKSDAVKEGLKPLLAPQTSTALAVAAIRAAADLGGDDFIAPLIQQAGSKDFNVRIAALEALSSRKTWTQAMLDAIAGEKVSASGFPAPVRRALATSKDKAIRDHAFKVLGAWQDSSDDVKSLIAQKKQAALTGEPDLTNGKVIFTAACMVCHEFHGGGQKVGPDLIGSGRSNLDAILANVIDPNQIIGNGYENFTVSTKDGRTLAGRVVEDTPGHVKLLGAGGTAQVVPRDQVATITNTKQSLMPMGFGMLPDAAFRDLIWYILAPPEEGPLTPAKKKLLIQGVEEPAAAKAKGNSTRSIDWESVSLWNPEWKVSAPDFERTPMKLAEYHGQTNVLLMHPFPDKKTPASLERKLKIEKTKLKVQVAADDRGDWIFKAVVNGQVVKEVTVDHEKPRWKTVEVDLAKFAGQEITVRLEAHASGWHMEFAYWGGIMLE